MRFFFLLSGLFFFFGISSPEVFASSSAPYHCPPLDTESGKKVLEYTFYTDYKEYTKVFEQSPSSAFEKVKELYHSRINERFNVEIARMKELAEKAYQEENLQKKSQEILEKTDPVLFTEELEERLREYQCVLYINRNGAKVNANGGQKQILDAMEELSSMENAYEVEIHRAEKALILTLRMYTDMRIYYTMHLKLQAIIQDIILEKTELRDLVGIILNMPAKFINASAPNPIQ